MAMVLVDTAVWIDHLHRPVPDLVALLTDGLVCCHPMIVGELALGTLKRRNEVIGLLTDLNQVTQATHREVLQLTESRELYGRGLSLIDVHLLASALLTPGTALWTRDKRLRAAAADAGVRWPAPRPT